MRVERAALYANPAQEIDPSQAREFAAMVRRRVGREPVAYILGRSSFRQIDLAVDRRVLIPRLFLSMVLATKIGTALHR